MKYSFSNRNQGKLANALILSDRLRQQLLQKQLCIAKMQSRCFTKRDCENQCCRENRAIGQQGELQRHCLQQGEEIVRLKISHVRQIQSLQDKHETEMKMLRQKNLLKQQKISDLQLQVAGLKANLKALEQKAE